MTSRYSILLIIPTVLLASTCFSDIIYVDDDAPPGGDGLSWTTAYNYLQDGLAVAASGDEIRVAAGVYKPDQGTGVTPGDRSASFHLINGVTLRGGYGGETILSGDLTGNDIPVANPTLLQSEPSRSDNSYTLVIGSNTDMTAVLDGFTITAGIATGPIVGHVPDMCGGGLYNYSGSPTVMNCIFCQNAALYRGGGNHNVEGSNPIFIRCVFSANMANDEGGGICNNFGSSPEVTDCIFDRNWVNNNGGGLNSDHSYSNPVVTNCIFSNNHATGLFGGGLGAGMCSQSGPNAIVTNCTFVNNHAQNKGGGICSEIAGNTTVTNCIFWGNLPDAIYSSDVLFTVSFSDIEGGWLGVGNIDLPPLFVDAAGGDYHLLPCSPCIDVGDNSAVVEILTDLDGNPRILNGIVDMGAYEGAIIKATIDIDPDTLNLSSKDKWITCYVELPGRYDVMDIDGSTVMLDSIPAYIGKEGWARAGANTSNIVDHDGDGIPERMVKFDKLDVQDYLVDLGILGDVELMVTGEFINGLSLEGTDTIRVIDKGGN